MADEKGKDDHSEARSNYLISRRKVRQFIADHPGTEQDLETFIKWCKTVEKADWQTFADVRESFPHADKDDERIWFNVGGGKYRVMVEIIYRPDNSAKILLRAVMPHKEYDRFNQDKQTNDILPGMGRVLSLANTDINIESRGTE